MDRQALVRVIEIDGQEGSNLLDSVEHSVAMDPEAGGGLRRRRLIVEITLERENQLSIVICLESIGEQSLCEFREIMLRLRLAPSTRAIIRSRNPWPGSALTCTVS